MRKKEYTFRAFLKSIDFDNKKIEFLFLDDEIEKFTKSFLSGYCNHMRTPVNSLGFVAKFDYSTISFSDKTQLCSTPLLQLVDKIVELTAEVKHYNFLDKNKTRIIGWKLLAKRLYACS